MEEPQTPDVYGNYSEFYDLYVGHRKIDLPFYLEYAKDIETSVLEIGAGTGRLTLPMAREGISVVAVDVSSSMLAILKSRMAEEPPEVIEKIKIVEVDVCQLELGAQYDLAMIPYYTFNYLLTDQDQTAALERVRAHLTPHGYVLIDVYIPWSGMEYIPPNPIPIMDAVDPSNGNRVKGWHSIVLDSVKQREYRTLTFEVSRANRTVVEKEFLVQRRYDLPHQLEVLFSTNGFSVESVFRGYQHEEPQPKSEQLLYVLKRSAVP